MPVASRDEMNCADPDTDQVEIMCAKSVVSGVCMPPHLWRVALMGDGETVWLLIDHVTGSRLGPMNKVLATRFADQRT